MLGSHLLATRGARSCADGSARASGLSAYSRPSTLLATRRCAKGGSSIWDCYSIPKKKQGPAKPSNTTRAASWTPPPYLNGLAMLGVHDHRPIWNFTYPQMASAVQQDAEVVASVQSFMSFGGTHLDKTLRNILQEEEKLLGPPRFQSPSLGHHS